VASRVLATEQARQVAWVRDRRGGAVPSSHSATLAALMPRAVAVLFIAVCPAVLAGTSFVLVRALLGGA
jgi:hypothetical protein